MISPAFTFVRRGRREGGGETAAAAGAELFESTNTLGALATSVIAVCFDYSV